MLGGHADHGARDALLADRIEDLGYETAGSAQVVSMYDIREHQR